jgi:hypothetical protein
MLGLNPANARSRLRAVRAAYEGPEYHVVLREGKAYVVDGRTREVTEVVAGALWLAGADLEGLARDVPFIDRKGPAMRAFAERVPGVELERHAEVPEIDPARWHWLHFGDRISDPRNVPAPLRPLIEALAASPIATRFYTYSSLNMLSFSASAHYPWADDRLPTWRSATSHDPRGLARRLRGRQHGDGRSA